MKQKERELYKKINFRRASTCENCEYSRSQKCEPWYFDCNEHGMFDNYASDVCDDWKDMYVNKNTDN